MDKKILIYMYICIFYTFDILFDVDREVLFISIFLIFINLALLFTTVIIICEEEVKVVLGSWGGLTLLCDEEKFV